jgi:hypothetical protein
MIRHFPITDAAEAATFYKSRRSALARVVGGQIFVFTPASASIGHPTGQVIEHGTVRV